MPEPESNEPTTAEEPKPEPAPAPEPPRKKDGFRRKLKDIFNKIGYGIGEAKFGS